MRTCSDNINIPRCTMEGRLFKAEWQKEVGLLHNAVVDYTLSMRSRAKQGNCDYWFSVTARPVTTEEYMDQLFKL